MANEESNDEKWPLSAVVLVWLSLVVSFGDDIAHYSTGQVALVCLSCLCLFAIAGAAFLFSLFDYSFALALVRSISHQQHTKQCFSLVRKVL